MENHGERTASYFVDESGDATFFNRRGEVIVGRPGCSPILLLGFVEMRNPRQARVALGELRRQLMADRYLRRVPSMKKVAISFHAKDDCPEVRKAVYELIMEQDFEFQCVVARKDIEVFLKEFDGSPAKFYDQMVSLLFKDVLHRNERNLVTFARRLEKTRQAPLEQAIKHGIGQFEAESGMTVRAEFQVQCHRPSGEPCLQIADYMNWAVQRAFLRNEMRYFDFVRDKVGLVLDLYDKKRHPKNRYDRDGNPFDVQKISPL